MARIRIAAQEGRRLDNPCNWGCGKADQQAWEAVILSVKAPLVVAREALAPHDFPPPPTQAGGGIGEKVAMGAYLREYGAQWRAFVRTDRGVMYQRIGNWVVAANARMGLSIGEALVWTEGALREMAVIAADGVGLLKEAIDKFDLSIEIPENVKEALERAQEEEDEWGFTDKIFGLVALVVGGTLFVKYRKDK